MRTTRRRALASTTLLIAIALLITACAARTNAPEKMANEERPTTGVMNEKKEGPGENGEESGASAELRALIKKGEGAVFTATYEQTSDEEGETVTMTIYASGKNSRTDMRTLVGEKEVETRTYLLDEKELISCTRQEEGWQCISFSLGTAEEPAGGTGRLDPEDEKFWEGVTVAPAPARLIAGQPARCYTITPKRSNGPLPEKELCYSEEGVPLSITVTLNGKSARQEAVTYEASVPPDAFKLPATPLSLEEAMTELRKS